MSICLKGGLKAKLKGVSKVREIVLNSIDVDSIFLDLAPEIFYFKHYVGGSVFIIFTGTPDVDNIGDAILVLS